MTPVPRAAERPDLRADCARCSALCCVALPFAASPDFALDKPAGRPCPNLRGDDRCGIHDRLRSSGFPGCTAYDCFGAGQQTTQHTFGGRSWREDPATARQVFAVFPVVRQLRELLWYLVEARALAQDPALQAALDAAVAETERLAAGTPEQLLALSVDAHRAATVPLLQQASRAARADVRRRRDLRGADLVGARLRGTDLRGADLRGARLVAADLRRADLRRADLTGADLRGADLRGADLREALFVLQAQVDAAGGDASTRLPEGVRRPEHWRT